MLAHHIIEQRTTEFVLERPTRWLGPPIVASTMGAIRQWSAPSRVAKRQIYQPSFIRLLFNCRCHELFSYTSYTRVRPQEVPQTAMAKFRCFHQWSSSAATSSGSYICCEESRRAHTLGSLRAPQNATNTAPAYRENSTML